MRASSEDVRFGSAAISRSRVAVRANHETKADTSVGASETAAGADSPSGTAPPHGSHRPPSASSRSCDADATERRAAEHDAHSVATSASWVARSDAAASVRAAWSRTASKPDRVGRDEDEHADSARSAAPVAARPGRRRVVKVSFAKRTSASSHTPGTIGN